MAKVKRLTLDVMKLHQPNIIEIAQKLNKIKGITAVNCVLIELDNKVESVKIMLEGSDVDYNKVEKVLKDNSATVHSIDEVVTGKKTEFPKHIKMERTS